MVIEFHLYHILPQKAPIKKNKPLLDTPCTAGARSDGLCPSTLKELGGTYPRYNYVISETGGKVLETCLSQRLKS